MNYTCASSMGGSVGVGEVVLCLLLFSFSCSMVSGSLFVSRSVQHKMVGAVKAQMMNRLIAYIPKFAMV